MNAVLNDERSYRWNFVVLTGLTILAIVTRGYGIWEWEIIQDEFFTIMWAHERYNSLINPLYYILVLGSFELFGVSEWSVRFPTFLIGVLTIPIFYLTWRSVIGQNVALIAALLIIFSSWHLWHSQYARFYAGVFLFGSLSYFLYYKAIQHDSLKYLLGALLANVVGILFHATAVMVSVACAVFSLFFLLSKQATKTGYSKRVASVHLIISIVAGLVVQGFFWQLLQNWEAKGQPWGSGTARLTLMIVRDLQIPIVIGAAFGLIILLKKDALKAAFFAIGIGVPLLTVLIGTTVVPIRTDYVIYITPLVIILAAYLCEQARQALSGHRFASHALTVMIIAALMPEMISYYTDKKTLNVREAVEFVKNAYQPDDRIVIFATGFNYYLRKDEYPFDAGLGNPMNVQRGWEQMLQPYKEGEQRVWMMLPARRTPLAKELESWLMNNATLVWRKYSTRYDWGVRGYEIFLVNGTADDFQRIAMIRENNKHIH